LAGRVRPFHAALVCAVLRAMKRFQGLKLLFLQLESILCVGGRIDLESNLTY
jgi:hypothetical protein